MVVVARIRDLFGWPSPSVVMTNAGNAFAAGLADGIAGRDTPVCPPRPWYAARWTEYPWATAEQRRAARIERRRVRRELSP